MLERFEHIEDAFLGDSDQVENALYFLTTYPNDKDNEFKTTLKWDGGLSIVFGIKPGTTDKFIIGTKGVFNKTPKYATNKIEIHKLFKPEVATILEAMFDELKAAIRKHPGLYQGDLMWDPTTVKKRKFKPNTLEYSFADGINAAFIFKHFKHSIAIHTQYTGDSIDQLSGHPFEPKETWNIMDRAARIFYIEPVTLKGEMVKAFQPLYYLGIISLQEKLDRFEPIDIKHTEILKRYVNYQVKKYGVDYIGNVPDIEELRNFVSTLGTKFSEKFEQDLYINHWTQHTILARLEAVAIVTILKTALIEMLNSPTRNFRIQVTDGEHEGFVVFEQKTSKAYKLINRHNFSYQNFKEHDEVING